MKKKLKLGHASVKYQYAFLTKHCKGLLIIILYAEIDYGTLFEN